MKALADVLKEENLKQWYSSLLSEYEFGKVAQNARAFLDADDKDVPEDKRDNPEPAEIALTVADQVGLLAQVFQGTKSPGLQAAGEKLQGLAGSDLSTPEAMKQVESAVNDASNVLRAKGPEIAKSLSDDEKKTLTSRLLDFGTTMKKEFHRIKDATGGIKGKFKAGLKSLAVAGLKTLAFASVAVNLVAKRVHPVFVEHGKEIGIIAGTAAGTAIAGATEGAAAPAIPLFAAMGGKLGEKLLPKLSQKIMDYTEKLTQKLDEKVDKIQEGLEDKPVIAEDKKQKLLEARGRVTEMLDQEKEEQKEQQKQAQEPETEPEKPSVDAETPDQDKDRPSL